MLLYFLPILLLIFSSCTSYSTTTETVMTDSLAQKDTLNLGNSNGIDSLLDKKDSLSAANSRDKLMIDPLKPGEEINIGDADPEKVIKFAESLVGTPYVYGSTDPNVGFDCSGFVTYVFTNFKIKVPRSSVQFTNTGKTVPVENAKRGDIALFTEPSFNNTNSTVVGHMGLITSNDNGIISFIHSTSGKAMSVVVTTLSEHYKKRFVRVARIFPQNDL